MDGSQNRANYRWYVLFLAAATATLAVAMQNMCLPVLFEEIAEDLGRVSCLLSARQPALMVEESGTRYSGEPAKDSPKEMNYDDGGDGTTAEGH